MSFRAFCTLCTGTQIFHVFPSYIEDHIKHHHDFTNAEVGSLVHRRYINLIWVSLSFLWQTGQSFFVEKIRGWKRWRVRSRNWERIQYSLVSSLESKPISVWRCFEATARWRFDFDEWRQTNNTDVVKKNLCRCRAKNVNHSPVSHFYTP